jgi:hypothetical protein
MKKTLFIALFWGILTHAFGQTTYATTDSTYMKLVEQAFELLKKGDCQTCLDKYEAAFKLSQKSVLSRLRAATCAFACKNEDKWRFHLKTALENDWGTVDNMLKDGNAQYPELTQYKSTDLYTTAQQQIKEFKKSTGFDEALAAELEVILKDDQALRQQLDSVKEGEKQAMWRKINELDAANVLKIEQIFLKHGYPGKSKVGGSLASVAFLVIQHADLPYQEKYFPLIEEAANKGELNKGSFALLVDRIRMRKGQKQLYGSQVTDNDRDGKWEFHAIEDEENVNKRRAEMGLGTIEEYAKNFNIEYKFVKKD